MTCEERPLGAVADKETEAELPASTDCLVGLTANLKSGVGGGGGPCPPPPPPHATVIKRSPSTGVPHLEIERNRAWRRLLVIRSVRSIQVRRERGRKAESKDGR